ncbi:MerR family transcriptional regulator [Nocardia sp. NBC_01377]|uniref:MerR family transcriptional regulator n=1 Tax=Nocardia sp. NBC_01377 TaxID=2903595 RepID=UPI003243BA6D
MSEVGITELARVTGLSVAAIKYYVREGLIEAPVRVSANRSDYQDSHVSRVRLIRALIELGGLSLADARTVIGAVEDPGRTTHSVLGVAQRAVSDSSIDSILTAADGLGHSSLRSLVDVYRDAANELAVVELDWVAQADGDRDTQAEKAVVGTILGDALLTAVRREAQRAESARRSHP